MISACFSRAWASSVWASLRAAFWVSRSSATLPSLVFRVWSASRGGCEFCLGVVEARLRLGFALGGFANRSLGLLDVAGFRCGEAEEAVALCFEVRYCDAFVGRCRGGGLEVGGFGLEPRDGALGGCLFLSDGG